MKYVEYGKENKDTIVLLHGGGLGTWNYDDEAKILKDRYHVLIPILDGHNGSDRNFTSIEDNADHIIDFIDKNFDGKVFMINGLSLGGQILVDIISKRNDICKYAIIESTLILPMKSTYKLIKPSFILYYPLINKKWFSKLQFKSLRIKEKYFDDYYRDSALISKDNLISFLQANSDFKINDNLKNTQANVLIIVGKKESLIMKKSACLLHKIINNSKLEVIDGYYHGDLSINNPNEYIKKIDNLIKNKCD